MGGGDALDGPDEMVRLTVTYKKGNGTRTAEKVVKAKNVEREIKALTYYADPQARVFQELRAARKVDGMPVSLIVDRDGCELGVIAGPADWAGEDALRLLRAAIGRDRPS